MFDVQPFLSLPIKTFVFSKPLVTNVDTTIYWRCKLQSFQAPNVYLHDWYRLILQLTHIMKLVRSSRLYLLNLLPNFTSQKLIVNCQTFWQPCGCIHQWCQKGFFSFTCTSSTVTCVALKTLKKVLKSHKVLLCKHSRHVPHAWASPHVSPNVQMHCCLKEESIPIFSQYSNVPVSKNSTSWLYQYIKCVGGAFGICQL